MILPRIVFMGSPEFALPALKRLAAQYPIAGVVTQPDRPPDAAAAESAVGQAAGRRAAAPRDPARAPQSPRSHGAAPGLGAGPHCGGSLRADPAPGAARPAPLGCINIHGSLLPRWRGAAPVQAAILNGDSTTGVTIMRMDPGVDTGPMLSQRSLPILPEDTAGSLGMRMAELGAELLLETLPNYLLGACIPQAQDDSQATYAPMIKKEDGELDFSLPAQSLARRVRAFQPLAWDVHTLARSGAQGTLGSRRPGKRPPAGAQAHI